MGTGADVLLDPCRSSGMRQMLLVSYSSCTKARRPDEDMAAAVRRSPSGLRSSTFPALSTGAIQRCRRPPASDEKTSELLSGVQAGNQLSTPSKNLPAAACAGRTYGLPSP